MSNSLSNAVEDIRMFALNEGQSQDLEIIRGWDNSMVFAMQEEDETSNNCTFDSSFFGIFVENSHPHWQALPKCPTEKGTGTEGK